MDTADRNDAPVASSSSRTYIRPELRAELDHLDFTGRVLINDRRVVASGAYGDISKSQCTLNDGRKVTVAIKRLRFYLKEDIDILFEKEIYVWSKLDHSNVLSLLGFAFEKPSGYPLLMSEWMSNGSSLSYVKSKKDCDLIRLVSGIAEGLSYLHDKGIIHSDIKPDNIVVTDSGDARICDFGGARIAAVSKSVAKPSTGIRGTLRYLSFELVALPDQYSSHTKESDVWAFGMTVFALFAQEHPYTLHADTQVSKAITNREIPSFNLWTSRSSEEKAVLRNICCSCWDHEPKRRVAMVFIATSLRDSERHINASRPLNEDDSEQETVKRRKITSSTVDGVGDYQLSENNSLYKPLLKLSSKLGLIGRCTETQSEVYQYLRAAMSLSSSLNMIFIANFQVDRKLDHLMCAMESIFDIVLSISTSSEELQDNKQTIIRALQQTIECCLFVKQYSQKRFEERVAGASSGRKIAELISFFIVFKESFDEGTNVLPMLVSSRASHEEIDDSVLLRRLSPSEADTKDQQHCLLGTRVVIQEQIIGWVLSPTAQNILWLHGVAGSGKSTVIASIAEYFRSIYRLGAFLRFKRGASDPSSVISTIAFKLALFDSTIGSRILAETDRDKDVRNASLSTQFEKLLQEPLSATAGVQRGPIIVVLDALDECGSTATRRTVMQILLRELPKLPLNFKFVITSRREQDIDRAFASLQPDSITAYELDYTSHVSCQDVQAYLNREIYKIVEDEDIPGDGSLESHLSIIGKNAAGLFVCASTIVKLVSEHDRPVEKLAELASNSRSLRGLDQLYTTVLQNSGISWHDSGSKSRFQRVIGLILLSKTPLTENMIDAILGSSVGKCRATLSRLRSVIDYRSGEPIRLFHTSLADYLISCGHTEDWFVDIPTQELFLAERCFEIMRDELRFNICDIKSSHICNNDDSSFKELIKKCISTHASYACNFWAQHLCKVPYAPTLIRRLSTFLYNHLLYWLEVLSLLKKVGMAGPALFAVMKWVGNHNAEITLFLRDARKLINIFALPISQSVPHIYLSMLPLTAIESKVSAHYLQRTSSLVRVLRKGNRHQSPSLKLLEGHNGCITSVDFSPDGLLIVSGSTDGTVKIWDSEKGGLVVELFVGHVGYIASVKFLPDSKLVVIGGTEGISVLDVESGSPASPFIDKYAKSTNSVAISPDGKHIVFGWLVFIDLWDVESENIVGNSLLGHTDKVTSVAYSSDGRLIVSGSWDKSVRVWDVESRRLVRIFSGHTGGVNSVAISPDGKYIVSGSYDNSIRIWDVDNGEAGYSPLTWHRGAVLSVVYSADGTRIVSCSADKTIMIWNSGNGRPISGPFIGHTQGVNSVGFSPDGTHVVSGSDDKTLRTWDADSGWIGSDSAAESVRSVSGARFSLDGTCVIASDGTAWRVEDGVIVAKDNNKREYDFGNRIKWDIYSGKVTSSWNGDWDYPFCIAVSPDERRIAFGSRDGSIRVWDKEHCALVCNSFGRQGGWVYSLAFSPDGRHIASGSNKRIWVWDSETGELLFVHLTGHTREVYSVAYSPDGRYIASGSYDDTARIWDTNTGHSEVFKGHINPVLSVSFSADGSRLVSNAQNSEVRVWNARSRESERSIAASSINHPECMLDKYGWVIGAHDELMLWVPPDLRRTLAIPPNIAILNTGDKFSTLLDFSDSAHGENWHKCFHPPG